MDPTPADPTPADPARTDPARADAGSGDALAPTWRLAPGVVAHGAVEGSGLREPSFLVERSDGQMLHVSALVHAVLVAAREARGSVALAAAVSSATGRWLTADGLEHLVRTRLQPVGLLVDAAAQDPPPTAPARARPVLALALRTTLLPARTVRRLAAVLAVLFATPVVVTAVTALVLLDLVLVGRVDPVLALEQVLTTPELLLTLFVLMTVGALVHECGHAAGCAAGGAAPGAIGMGVYLLFPAFYTDVTASYRLDRAGRLRTDLGGLYFNVWCLLAAGGGYLLTGEPVLLLVVVLMHLEMAQQLVPTVRFDGYFVLADLAGVPDPFSRVLPVLRGLVPGRPVDPRVAELTTSARRVVTAWVLVVVPTLALGLGWLLWHLPRILSTSLVGLGAQADLLATAWQERDPVSGTLALLALVLLSVPLLGLAVLLPRLALAPVRGVRRRRTAATPPGPAPRGGPTADLFTDEVMLDPRRPAATRGWRAAVARATRGRVRPRPGRRERVEAALVARVRRPMTGTRRVVVMSRKRGVGKTTVTLLLGATTATLRGDRVVAVDANPDAGNLAHRVGDSPGCGVTDVLRDPAAVDSYARLRRLTAQTAETPLEVLASDDDARISTALTDADYHEVVTLLDRFYTLVLLDTGTGILDSANQGLVAEADQLVVVLPPALDGARAAALTLDWLAGHGYAELVRDSVVVVNGVRRRGRVPLDRLTAPFDGRCRAVHRLPWDPALEAGGRTGLSLLRPRTRRALVELAASVVDGFDTPRRAGHLPSGEEPSGAPSGPGAHPPAGTDRRSRPS